MKTKKSNPVNELFNAAGYAYEYKNTKRAVKTLNTLLASEIVRFKVCTKGNIWESKEGKVYNLVVYIKGHNFKYFKKVRPADGVCAFDALRFIGEVLQKPDVKQVVKSYVNIDSSCQKCSGIGFIQQFHYYCNGVCFDCCGTGFNRKHQDVVEIIS